MVKTPQGFAGITSTLMYSFFFRIFVRKPPEENSNIYFFLCPKSTKPNILNISQVAVQKRESMGVLNADCESLPGLLVLLPLLHFCFNSSMQHRLRILLAEISIC